MFGSLIKQLLGGSTGGGEPGTLLAEGYASFLKGEHARARDLALGILALEPHHKGAHLLMAQICAAEGGAAPALEWIEKLLGLDSQHAEAYFLRGLIMGERGRSREAIADYDRALCADPAHQGALDRKGAAHDELGEFEQSLACAERLIELAPRDARGHHKKGLMLRELGQIEQAAQSLRQGVALEPELRDAACHLALVLIDQGRFEEARRALSRVLSAAPEDVEARWTMALLYLLQGRFEPGWKYYESREARRKGSNRGRGLPEWDGRPLREGALLIYSEQGLGDEIMFASCFPDALERAPSCAIECEPRLAKIFQRSFARAIVLGGGAGREPGSAQHAMPPLVAQIATGSLPALFRNQWSDFPRHDGYLVPDPGRVAHWRARLAALGTGPKIGLAWTGGTIKTRRRLRSLSLAELRPVLSVTGAHFVSLQYVESAHEIAALAAADGILVHRWPEAGADFDETAALIAALDVVVSVCTAAVHLAGAVGKRTWVMVPATPEWRYLAGGEQMPWYPAARLFRQQRSAGWQPVIERVAGELRAFASQSPCAR